MKAQTITTGRKAQEYLAVGAVVAAAGVMFIAGSLQLTAEALRYTRGLAFAMVVLGSVLMGLGLGTKPRLNPMAALKATPKAVPAVKAKAAPKKRNARSKKK
jgi:hypothetical protein